MGCDIHGHFEVKINGNWEHYTIPPIKRNYAAFEKLAGVRGSIDNAISPPKGLPDGLSLITKMDAEKWEADAHSHSWLSAEEFKGFYDWYCALDTGNFYKFYDNFGFLFSNGFESFERGSEDYPKEIEDFRFIFWFDN